MAAQRKVAGTFALAVVLAIGIGVVSYWSVSRLRHDAAWVAHTRQVIGSLQELLSTLASAQSAISAPGCAAQIAQALIEQLRAPFALRSGAEVSIGASAGISLFPTNGDDAQSLIRCADAALYAAKAAGRGTWRFCDP